MHFLLSYQIDPISDNCNLINQSIETVLAQYEKVNVFGSNYIIKIGNIEDWDKIRTELQRVTSTNGCDCKFIMTPITQGGYYNGWLERDKWPLISNLINSEVKYG